MEKVIKNIVIILLTQIILTTVILFVSSGIIWKYAYDEKAISAVVTGTYIVVNILGGIIAGKLFKKNNSCGDLRQELYIFRYCCYLESLYLKQEPQG